MVIDELIYFSAPGVEVTSLKFVVDDTVYSIAYIQSVETKVEEKAKVRFRLVPILVGAILFLVGFLAVLMALNIDEQAMRILITLFGISSAFIGLVLFSRSLVIRRYKINHLILTTMVDKYDAFQSQDGELFRAVTNALQNAVDDREVV